MLDSKDQLYKNFGILMKNIIFMWVFYLEVEFVGRIYGWHVRFSIQLIQLLETEQVSVAEHFNNVFWRCLGYQFLCLFSR